WASCCSTFSSSCWALIAESIVLPLPFLELAQPPSTMVSRRSEAATGSGTSVRACTATAAPLFRFRFRAALPNSQSVLTSGLVEPGAKASLAKNQCSQDCGAARLKPCPPPLDYENTL